MESTTRVQFLHYELIRSGYCNANEQAVLNYIMTFSQNCRLPQRSIAKGINKSISTVRRTINSLIQKGMITRRYTDYKRCVLQIVSLEIQAKLLSLGGKMKQIFKAAKQKTKKLMKSYDRSPKNNHDRSPVNEPTRNETKEIKLFKIELKPEKKDFETHKMESIAKFRLWQSQQI